MVRQAAGVLAGQGDLHGLLGFAGLVVRRRRVVQHRVVHVLVELVAAVRGGVEEAVQALRGRELGRRDLQRPGAGDLEGGDLALGQPALVGGDLHRLPGDDDVAQRRVGLGEVARPVGGVDHPDLVRREAGVLQRLDRRGAVVAGVEQLHGHLARRGQRGEHAARGPRSRRAWPPTRRRTPALRGGPPDSMPAARPVPCWTTCASSCAITWSPWAVPAETPGARWTSVPCASPSTPASAARRARFVHGRLGEVVSRHRLHAITRVQRPGDGRVAVAAAEVEHHPRGDLPVHPLEARPEPGQRCARAGRGALVARGGRRRPERVRAAAGASGCRTDSSARSLTGSLSPTAPPV